MLGGRLSTEHSYRGLKKQNNRVWGILYYSYNKEPPKPYYSGPYGLAFRGSRVESYGFAVSGFGISTSALLAWGPRDPRFWHFAFGV